MAKQRQFGQSIPYYIWAPLVVAITPLIGTLVGRSLYKDTLIKKLENSKPQMAQLDRDNLLDLIDAEGRILLADLSEGEIIYRPLGNSDIYRIK